MAGRYSEILKAQEYEKALDNYIDYIQNADNRPSKRLQGGTPGKSIPRTNVTLTPFGGDFSGSNNVFVTASKNAIDQWSAQIGTRVRTAPTSLADSVRIAGFRPAKLKIFQPEAGNPTYVQSQITGLYYLKYPGENFTVPFGALNDSEEEATAARSLKGAILQSMTREYKRVSVTPEKIPV
jgi:hypothetical protein